MSGFLPALPRPHTRTRAHTDRRLVLTTLTDLVVQHLKYAAIFVSHRRHGRRTGQAAGCGASLYNVTMSQDHQIVFVPKVSWTSNDAPSAVSYGALVGTPNYVFLLPRAGTETAGFTLKLQWSRDNPLDDIAAVVHSENPLEQIESTLRDSLTEWSTRCEFPVAKMSRFEIFKGWKLWLGVSAALQVEGESAVGVRIKDKSQLEALRTLYGK